MSKSNKKTYTPRDREKTAAVNWVAKEFLVTPQYVYGILNNQHTAGRYIEIKDAYQKKYTELKKVLA